MVIAFALVLVLVGISPVVLTLDGVVLPSLVPILVAIGLVFVAARIEAADRQRCAELARPLAIATAALASWILVQMLPLPIASTPPLSWITELVHPVWQSAAEALRSSIVGRITVDVGVTAVALVWVLSLAGVVLLTMAVTIARDRAEVVLVGLTIATALIAAVAAGADLLDVGFFAARAEALDSACLGLVLASASGALAYTRGRARRQKQGRDQSRLGPIAYVSAAAFLTCLVAIFAARSGSLLFAAAGGLATFGAVAVVRRLALGRWGAVAIGGTGIVIGVALVLGAAGRNPDPRLAFVKANQVSLELTQRILADSPFLGTGAGTFAAMVPIYRPGDTGTAALTAVTAAAKVSIEMGRPVLWLSVVAAVITALWLLRGALRRGRDYYYPAAGAASLVTLTILAFVNAGLFGSAISVLAAVVLGLALAQARGSTAAS